MDQTPTVDATKSKGITELHFNAINNSTIRKNHSSSSLSKHDDSKRLLPSQTKYILMPSTSSTQQSIENSKYAYGNNNPTSQSPNSSAINSTVASPTDTPKPFNHLKSGKS